MKDERIEEHLQRLNGYLIRLKKYAGLDVTAFVNDDTIIAATERNLQLAIETCLNIGNRIISLEQFKDQLKIPENYSDIFRQLVRLNLISSDKLDSFINMAKLRNRLVHIYWEIDSNLLYSYPTGLVAENVSNNSRSKM